MTVTLPQTQSVRTGILCIVLGLTVAALGGALMKLAGDVMSPGFVIWLRFLGYMVIVLPIVLWRSGRRAFAPPRLDVQIIRGVLMAAGNLAFIYGVVGLDYADAIAILYVYPFLMTLLAPFVLQERVSLVAWLGVTGGFLGVLLVVRPSLSGIDYHALLVLGTGLSVAFQMLLNRKLGLLADPLVISLWGAIVPTVLLLPLVPFFWSPIPAEAVWVLIAIPFTTAVGQTLMILGMARAEAATLAPFTYTEIVAAIILGLMIFGTIPDILSWMGIGLITVCGILVARAKTRSKTRETARFRPDI